MDYSVQTQIVNDAMKKERLDRLTFLLQDNDYIFQS
jgi:hypothetical protein